jgi:hypothetical protein
MINNRQAVAMAAVMSKGLKAFDDQIDAQRELPHSHRKGTEGRRRRRPGGAPVPCVAAKRALGLRRSAIRGWVIARRGRMAVRIR